MQFPLGKYFKSKSLCKKIYISYVGPNTRHLGQPLKCKPKIEKLLLQYLVSQFFLNFWCFSKIHAKKPSYYLSVDAINILNACEFCPVYFFTPMFSMVFKESLGTPSRQLIVISPKASECVVNICSFCMQFRNRGNRSAIKWHKCFCRSCSFIKPYSLFIELQCNNDVGCSISLQVG